MGCVCENICGTVANCGEKNKFHSITVHPVYELTDTQTRTLTLTHAPLSLTLSFLARLVERFQILLKQIFFSRYLYLQAPRRLVIRRPHIAGLGWSHPELLRCSHTAFPETCSPLSEANTSVHRHTDAEEPLTLGRWWEKKSWGKVQLSINWLFFIN